jgi:hypothetical protein
MNVSNVIQFRRADRPVVNQPREQYWEFANGVRVPYPETGEQYLECVRQALPEYAFLRICGGILSAKYYEELDETTKTIVKSFYEFDR